jgi:hypothetical protein
MPLPRLLPIDSDVPTQGDKYEYSAKRFRY